MRFGGGDVVPIGKGFCPGHALPGLQRKTAVELVQKRFGEVNEDD